MNPSDAHFDFACERRSDSTPGSLWKVLSQIEQWPQWAPGIQSARLDGALLPGAGFRWRANGISIRSTFVEVERPHSLTWIGSGMGISVRHQWSIQSIDGGSSVRTQEWVRTIWPFRGMQERSMRNSVTAWLDALIGRARQEVPCD